MEEREAILLGESTRQCVENRSLSFISFGGGAKGVGGGGGQGGRKKETKLSNFLMTR